jgi:molecular chaperone GrpE
MAEKVKQHGTEEPEELVLVEHDAAPENPATGEATEEGAALAALKAERDALLDRLARLQAEFDNARKRQEREKQEFRDYATGSVVEQFLPVIDNFALALNANASADQMRTGVELILKQMDETLRQLQVQAIPTVGQPFDPRLHEALGSVEREDVPDHSIIEEIRKGYRIRERLLRPAMVRIAINPKQTEA